jgi:hypothetical protein
MIERNNKIKSALLTIVMMSHDKDARRASRFTSRRGRHVALRFRERERGGWSHCASQHATPFAKSSSH